MEFTKYPKIHRLGKEETIGILNGHVSVQEKIDGANASIWMENGDMNFGSRNVHLKNNGFNGFVDYVKNHDGIREILEDYDDHILYGEWLVKHRVNYKLENYKLFYLFDILGPDGFLSPSEVYRMAKEYVIFSPFNFGEFYNPSVDNLMEFVGYSKLGAIGEGIVIKNSGFVNKFGDLCYAKIISKEFSEEKDVDRTYKNDANPSELYIVNKYVNHERVEKVCNKLRPVICEPLGLKHIPRICEAVYHDLLTEEIWDISKKISQINFHALKKLCLFKSKEIYKTLIEVRYEVN